MDRNAEKSFHANAIQIQNEAQKRKSISSGDKKLAAQIVKIDNNQILEKCFSYVFKIFNIDVKITRQEDNFHISNIRFHRIGTGNDGNHIIPISSFTSLIQHFFTAGDKTNDCISKVQRLLAFFHNIPNSTEEYNAIYAKLCKITNEDSQQDTLEIFFQKTVMPYIIYIWDTRVSAKHFDSVDKTTVSSAGSKVRVFNQAAKDLLSQLNTINSDSFYCNLSEIRDKLFLVIDIPIFVQKNTSIKECSNDSNKVNQYFKEVLLFFICRVIKIQKPDTQQKKDLIDNIQHLQNKTSEINTQKISNLVSVLSQLQQKMSSEHSTIVNKLSAMKDIQDFCLNNTASLSHLVKEYLDIILYDLRKHFQLYFSIIEQEASKYSDNMHYLQEDAHKQFLIEFFNKKNFAREFINKCQSINNKNTLIEMFDHDNALEASFAYSDDQSVLSQNESYVSSKQALQYKNIDVIARLESFEQIKLIEDILNASGYEPVMSKLANCTIDRTNAIKWYCRKIQQKDKEKLQAVKNILTKCTTTILKENILIQGKKPYAWYLDNENDHDNRMAVTQSILSQDDDTYIIGFVQYILTKDETVIASKVAQKYANSPFIVWYIDTISGVIDQPKYLDSINNILTKCDGDTIQKVLHITIENKKFLEWYIENKKINNTLKSNVIESVISKCKDDTIFDLIYIISEYSDQSSIVQFTQKLISMRIGDNNLVLQWYLSNSNVDNDKKSLVIANLVSRLDTNHSTIVEIIKYIFTINDACLIKALISVKLSNNDVVQWYLSSSKVTHNEKVTAINSIIPIFEDDNISTMIKDILTGNSTDLKKELANIQVHNKHAIKWYLDNNNVTHNEKVTAINSIIPIFEDDNISTMIKDILTGNSTDLKKELANIQVHNKHAIKWYLDNNNVTHNEKVTAINSIIPIFEDDTLYDIIDYSITNRHIRLLKALDTKTTTSGLSILRQYIQYIIDPTHDIIDETHIVQSLYTILTECSNNTIQSIEQLNYNNRPIFYWYIRWHIDGKMHLDRVAPSLHNILIKCSRQAVQYIDNEQNDTSLFLEYTEYIQRYGADFYGPKGSIDAALMDALCYIQLKCDAYTIEQISKLYMHEKPMLEWYNSRKSYGLYEMDGLDQKSIHYNLQNIHGAKRMLNQSKVIVEYVHEYNKYLSILGIQDYKNNNHAVVFFKYGDSLSIIDPLDYISGCSNSFIKLKNQFLSSEIKTIDIVYSGLQQPDSGVCADISLILVKNLADKLQDIQSIQDVISIIQDVRIEMYGRTSEKNQETIIIKSFDAVIPKVIYGLTRLNNYDVGIQDQQQQNNCSVNNEFVSTVQQDNFFIKPTELTGDIVSYTT